VIFWNRPLSVNTNYQFYSRVLERGPWETRSCSTEQRVQRLSAPSSRCRTRCRKPRASTARHRTRAPEGASRSHSRPLRTPRPCRPTAPADGGVPDAGTPDAGLPDAGSRRRPAGCGRSGRRVPGRSVPDAGTPDAGSPDAGPPPQAGVLFSDDSIERSIRSGPKWTIVAGAWRTDGRANSDRSMLDRAAPKGVSCADCRIDARMVKLRRRRGDARAARLRRGPVRACAHGQRPTPSSDAYRAGVKTLLGSTSTSIPDLKSWHAFSFTAQGTVPVTLTAWVDGAPRHQRDRFERVALSASGAPDRRHRIRILIDDFTLTGAARPASPRPRQTRHARRRRSDGGAPDGGIPDADPSTAELPRPVPRWRHGHLHRDQFDLMAVDPQAPHMV